MPGSSIKLLVNKEDNNATKKRQRQKGIQQAKGKLYVLPNFFPT